MFCSLGCFLGFFFGVSVFSFSILLFVCFFVVFFLCGGWFFLFFFLEGGGGKGILVLGIFFGCEQTCPPS